jgi:hypothetical protein
MYEYRCCECGYLFRTEVAWNRIVEPICFDCAMDEFELEGDK